MSESDKKKPNRRDFIITATTAAGAVGVGAAAWPLIDQMNPDASVKALASTEVDISGVQSGQSITVLWRGKPVFIKRRTQEEIDSARSVDLKDLKHPEKDEERAKNPEFASWLVWPEFKMEFEMLIGHRGKKRDIDGEIKKPDNRKANLCVWY